MTALTAIEKQRLAKFAGSVVTDPDDPSRLAVITKSGDLRLIGTYGSAVQAALAKAMVEPSNEAPRGGASLHKAISSPEGELRRRDRTGAEKSKPAPEKVEKDKRSQEEAFSDWIVGGVSGGKR